MAIAVVCLLAAAAGAEASDPLRLVGGAHLPVPGSGPAPPPPAALPAVEAGLVQLDGPVRRADLEALRAGGVRIHHAVPDHALLVSGTRSALAALRGLPRVRWVGHIPPGLQRAPALAAARPDEEVEVVVRSVRPLPDAWWRARGARVDAQGATAAGAWQVRAHIRAAHLDELEALRSVFYLGPAEVPRLWGEREAMVALGRVAADGEGPAAPGYAEALAAAGLGGGAGQVVQVQDDGLDRGDASNAPGSAHPDLLGRIAGISNASAAATGGTETGHGQLVASVIVADATLGSRDAGGFRHGQGLAPAAALFATKIFARGEDDGVTITGTEPAFFEALATEAWHAGARVSNNSWGGALDGSYTTLSAVFDALTRDVDAVTRGHQEMLYVFAAGNADATPGTLSAPATAKNVLAVGAVETDVQRPSCSFGTDSGGVDALSDRSARGPAADGRRGIDLVAVGINVDGARAAGPGNDESRVCPVEAGEDDRYARGSGTSLAAPQVAGAALVLRELFASQLAAAGHDADPSPALLRAAFAVATRGIAGEGGGPPPDPAQGFGRLDLSPLLEGWRWLHTVDQTEVLDDAGQERSWTLHAASPDRPLRAVLAWTDPPACPCAGAALVNDLDLEVDDGVTLWRGNVLDEGVSVPGGSADRLENLEVVVLEGPAAGPLDVRVRAHEIPGDGLPGVGPPADQDFALLVANVQTESALLELAPPRLQCDERLEVRLSDAGLRGAGSVPVTIESASGDRETLLLAESPPDSGWLAGAIDAVEGSAVAEDGRLDVASVDAVDVAYDDALDATGRAVRVAQRVGVDCENLGFEQGGFDGWSLEALGSVSFDPEIVGAGVAYAFGLFESEPTEGELAFLFHWRNLQSDPGELVLSRSFDVPSPEGTLELDYRAGWIRLPGLPPRRLAVTVEPEAGGVPSEHELLVESDDDLFDTGPLQAAIDLTPFAGERVRVALRFQMPGQSPFSAQVQIDDVRVVPEPGAAARAVAAGLALAALRWRRRPCNDSSRLRSSGRAVSSRGREESR